jgi:two-component system sensor histidine kinase UhpB
VTLSAPIRTEELIGVLIAFVIMLVLYRALLQRALAPLHRLTALMHRIDPLRPGQRIATDVRDEEVAALTEAFNAMLDRLETERRDSGRRALAAQEAERQRIARELHDEIGQLLTGLMLQSETVSRRAPAELSGDFEGLREGARAAAEEVRLIAQRLRPEALDELGLQSALLALCTTVAERAGLKVERQLERGLDLSDEEELVVYRVAQESLTNVVRHAEATSVRVKLAAEPDGGVHLSVADDGRGIPAHVDGRSSGLIGMRERALLVGGDLTIRPVTPHGTEVILRLPGGDAP